MLIKTNKIIVIEAESVSPSLHTWTQESQKNLVGTSMGTGKSFSEALILASTI